ncbi:DUF6331 family protein [Vicingaceae bacterium]|nr:DUF6331 family protein [Vicingaceae bacterium]
MGISKDISIGEEKWIKWIEFDAESASPKDIDKLLEPTKEFWNFLEIECLAECCGIDAFAFWSEDIQNADDKARIPNLRILLNEITKEVESLTDEVVVSSRLNQLMNRKVFLKLLEHLKKNIKST